MNWESSSLTFNELYYIEIAKRRKMKKLGLIFTIFCLIASVNFAQQDEILKLKEKIIDLQNKGELGFQDFTLCSKIIGFGSYVPLPDNTLDKNSELLIYYEPINVFTNKREGLYEIWYTQDMILMKSDGTVIQEWKDKLNFHYTTKKPVMDLFAENSITLGGQLPAGEYKFKAILKDKLGGKSATKIIDFKIK
jgi:hypothetical protein